MTATEETAPGWTLGSLASYMVSYRGWRMVLVAFLCLVFAFGAPVSLTPLIYGPVMDEFGWSRTVTTLLHTYKDLASAVVALFVVGPLLNRLGLRRVIVGSCLSTALGMLAFLWIRTLVGYYAAGILLGISGTALIIGINVFVSRWFTRNQGVAIGITVAGISTGGALFPIIGNAIMQAYDWRVMVAVASIGIILVAIPLYLLVAEENPAEEDILPEMSSQPQSPEMTEKIRAADLEERFPDLLRTPMLWCLVGASFLTAIVDNGLFQHTMLYVEREAGLSAQAAALGLSGTFAMGIAAKILAGKVYDRFSVNGVIFWYLFVGLSVALAFPVAGTTTLILFTVVRGLAHGGLITKGAVITKHCYGPRLMNSALPVFVGFNIVGSALGPTVLSVLYDRFGSYDIGFALFILMTVMAAVLMWRVYPLYRQRLKAVEAEYSG